MISEVIEKRIELLEKHNGDEKVIDELTALVEYIRNHISQEDYLDFNI